MKRICEPRPRGMIFFECLAYLAVFAVVMGCTYQAWNMLSLAMRRGAERERQLEHWISFSENFREDLRQARHIQWSAIETPIQPGKPGQPLVQVGPVLHLTGDNGASIEYCNCEYHAELEPPPPPLPQTPRPPAPRSIRRRQAAPALVLSPPPRPLHPTPILPPACTKILLRRVTNPDRTIKVREERNIVLNQVQIPKPGSEDPWDLQVLSDSNDLDSSKHALFLLAKFDLLRAPGPPLNKTVAAATRLEAPEPGEK